MKAIYQLLLAAAIAACGSDGGDGQPDTDPRLTPKGEWELERGKILALRASDAMYLDEQLALEIDSLLARVDTLDSGYEDFDFASATASSDYRVDFLNIVPGDESLAQSLRSGQLETGDPQLDSVLQSLNHTIILEGGETFAGVEFSVYYSRWVKVSTLLAELADSPLLDAYALSGPPGKDIELADMGDVWEVTYYLRWGDCVNGCTHQHYWRVEVPKDANLPASLIEDGGDVPLPSSS